MDRRTELPTAIELVHRIAALEPMRWHGPPDPPSCAFCGGTAYDPEIWWEPRRSEPSDLNHTKDCPWVDAYWFTQGLTETQRQLRP